METAQAIPVLLTESSAPSKSAGLPVKDVGTTYSMAQAVRWLDEHTFAIGRWDGTLTVFQRRHVSAAPIISAALTVPSFGGIEMIARIKPSMFASSNEACSIIVWQGGSSVDCGIRFQETLLYDQAIGVANDGTTTEYEGELYFISAHANGFLLVWHVGEDSETFELLHTIDVRSPDPIPSPYQLKNIRGVERWQPGFVVTGSEDGDICLINILEGMVVDRMRYNECAQRGINDIDSCGDHLLVSNCSVGPDDKNLWLYRVKEDGFELLDSVNLRVDSMRNQVFNFCIDQALVGDKQYFFSATQEGVVWIGFVENDRLVILGKREVSTRIGAALAYEPTSRLLAVAGDNIHLFEVTQ